ncbi:hypothetical protein KRP22_009117 [Phytophthora ramorum]|nr:hypothetical protein KRP23_2199 [Phytophthora ramorum]KAH7502482.1 hypothetical protein KRP22_7948 [Phytophthora ramorum]
MTGRMDSRTREAEEVLPLLALEAARQERAGYVSYALKTDAGSSRRQLTALYGSMPTRADDGVRKSGGRAPLGPRASGNQSETESDSDGSCTGASSSTGSLQSILRIPSGDFSCRSLKKKVSVEFVLDIDDDDDAKRKIDGSCAVRCMPRRLTIEEKAALYQVRPDLELVPTVLLLSELEEMRRRRQRKLLFSILGASLILLMMIVFYYLVSQM